jgi:hypothetical protein
MKYSTIIAIIFFFTAITLISEPADTNKTTVTSAPPDSFEQILVKLRDPFWPIGWKPQPSSQETSSQTPVVSQQPQPQSQTPTPTTPSETSDWEEAWKTIKIKAKSQNWAIIEGPAVIPKGPVSTGDVVSVIYKGHKYRWEIISITREEGITAKRIDVSKINQN